MKSQEFSDISLSNSCNSDLDVPSLVELPEAKLHKLVVKKDKTLFSPVVIY